MARALTAVGVALMLAACSGDNSGSEPVTTTATATSPTATTPTTSASTASTAAGTATSTTAPGASTSVRIITGPITPGITTPAGRTGDGDDVCSLVPSDVVAAVLGAPATAITPSADTTPAGASSVCSWAAGANALAATRTTAPSAAQADATWLALVALSGPQAATVSGVGDDARLAPPGMGSRLLVARRGPVAVAVQATPGGGQPEPDPDALVAVANAVLVGS